ncbi:Two-component system sensor histidine kinase [Bacteroides ovatus]|jgi:two-component system sensor histidine kinase|uniref:sensor histidine kinase n=1 Tax=Bacteroides TaxID=816 RepID=UPI000E941298|nr:MULTISPECIES: HAMP domain-containing sensor histidine kinase [Bacteroides]MCS3177481.1 HAMP domain-containing histidine kinase [Candidatus Bacteroides intestinigallinarum]RGN55817.1 sensor histidine kinase [Bacteroides sp. OM05-10AA]RGQ60978.1 sensor histidine kinase [Bacteroides sp. AF27-33]CAG9889040.1 Two-component system sensor histidine kinase [Bacteroides ovatus]
MRYILLFFVIFLLPLSLQSKENTADSLKTLFIHAQTQQERMERCLNLDNYYRNYLFKDSIPLTRILFDEGVKAKNEYIIADALRKLIMNINRKERVLTNDSVIYYLKLADKYLTGERKKSFITEVHLKNIRSIADWTDNEGQTIEYLTKMYTDPEENQEDIYFQIERNYALGMATTLTISETRIENYKNASRYFDRVFELLLKLPVEHAAELLFWANDNIYLSYLNSREGPKTVAFLEKMMDILEHYKEMPEVKKDIYQNFEYVYSLYYMGIAHFPSLVGYEKAYHCLEKTDEMLRKRGEMLTLYFAYEGFYEDARNYRMAIAYKDSVINTMGNENTAIVLAVTSSMYKEQAKCYARLHDYKDAYERMEIYDSLREKVVDAESSELRAEMDTRYDLNHLELEKERLTSRNRQIGFLSISFVLLLSIVWGISQRIHLNKLKRMQKELLESNEEVLRQSEKAQESEKMKTAFINSMCHEIRTPLNAINGFSNLLLDETIDAECKVEFPELIQQNTDLLTRLLNDLLEVSNLSSSVEELPMEKADICSICVQEMDRLQTGEGKASIHYCLDVDNGDCNIRTNIPYLSQTLAHLLNNANKFTESGEIKLSCHREGEQLVIKVTDTGIGIPEEKQEWVFDRFTKLDEFKPGAGLGLYICRLIVRRLGGTINIDREYTGGTRFVLVFPVKN